MEAGYWQALHAEFMVIVQRLSEYPRAQVVRQGEHAGRPYPSAYVLPETHPVQDEEPIALAVPGPQVLHMVEVEAAEY